MIRRMAKAQEDMDDLKFQLEEKNIEFEGTRAQLRVLESKNRMRPEAVARSTSSFLDSQEDGLDMDGSSARGENRMPVATHASMRAMVPLLMTDDVQLQHSSSTESAHDHTEQQQRLQQSQQPQNDSTTPKKRIPSRIPLPGSSPATPVTPSLKAPKPPSGRKASAGSNIPSAAAYSGPPSNRSMHQIRQISTSNSSLNNNNRKETSLTRPDSANSWRNSYQTQSPLATTPPSKELHATQNTPSPYRNSSSSVSSIPISTTASVNSVGSSSKLSTSPPVKNSSLGNNKSLKSHATGNLRARNLMDSLTGPGQPQQQQSVKSPGNSMSSAKLSSTNSSTTPVTMILNNSNNNKSHTQSNPSRMQPKASAVPVRRTSSRTSIGSAGGGLTGADDGSDNGKVRNLRSSIWNWLKI